MAIAGLLVHCLKDKLGGVEARIGALPGMSVYAKREDQYLVVVAEAPSSQMEKAVEGLENIEGVLAVYTTYVTTEDEATDAPV
jgi:nitrate reductase NapAB chaperone NapD